MYPDIHAKIHDLEALLAEAMNLAEPVQAREALEKAHDYLVHQVAEYVRTAENRLKE